MASASSIRRTRGRSRSCSSFRLRRCRDRVARGRARAGDSSAASCEFPVKNRGIRVSSCQAPKLQIMVVASPRNHNSSAHASSVCFRSRRSIQPSRARNSESQGRPSTQTCARTARESQYQAVHILLRLPWVCGTGVRYFDDAAGSAVIQQH
jgi:hypothetical protein